MDLIVCYVSKALSVFKQTYDTTTGGCSTDKITTTYVVDFTSVTPLKGTTLVAFYSTTQIEVIDLSG